MNLTDFKFKSETMRTVDKEGEVWFIATDVAKILGYRDAANMVRKLDEDEADTRIVSIRSENGVEQDREVTIISESGLYSAIFGSRKSIARQFKRWVTHDVLPSIRKFGSYTLTPGAQKLLQFNTHDVKSIANGLEHIYRMREANYMKLAEQEKTAQIRHAQKHDELMLALEARICVLEVKVDVLTKGGEQNEEEWQKIKSEGFGTMSFEYLH